jgi:hypothetical protein
LGVRLVGRVFALAQRTIATPGPRDRSRFRKEIRVFESDSQMLKTGDAVTVGLDIRHDDRPVRALSLRA